MPRRLEPGTAPRGFLITFEGGEGSGKSTQVAALVSRLRDAGREAITAREPGGTALGEVIRPLTRKPAIARRVYRSLTGDDLWAGLTPHAEMLLYEAARAQLVNQVVAPSLATGAVVILDRFTDSTLAYQGYGRGIDLAQIAQINAIATDGIAPNLTLLLDLDVAAGLGRKHGEAGRDAIGSEDRSFHERVRAGYLALAAAEPDRWVVLDATQPPDALSEQIWQIVRQRLAAESTPDLLD